MNKGKKKVKPKNKVKDDYKDYMLIFCHKKNCIIYLDNGVRVEGLVKAKDRYNIMVLNCKIRHKNAKMEVERIIIQKSHIVGIIPIEES